MKLYCKGENYTLYQGNVLDMMQVIKPNSIDSIVTDPPYELNFMSKGWDNSGIAFQKDAWRRCFDALKSGGYLLAFGGSRTFHRIACAIEDAGFEIRDVIMWLYGSGFPKSMNVGLAIDKKNGVDNRTGNIKKDGSSTGSIVTTGTGNLKREYEERVAQNEWSGWGSALKPSYEPIIVARKPFAGSLVDNVLKNGVGGLNIDECRVETEDNLYRKPCENGSIYSQQEKQYTTGTMNDSYKLGRFPANTILTYDDTDCDEVCGGMPDTKSTDNIRHNNNDGKNYNCYGNYGNVDTSGYDDSGSASRYFYCAKASKKDRDEGLGMFDAKSGGTYNFRQDGSFCGKTVVKRNTHPTVKPTDLMQYLVRLVTPDGGTVLDPFNGSGSTGKAVMYENTERQKGYKYIGIELTPEYLPISQARIEYATKPQDSIIVVKDKQTGNKEQLEQITLF